MKLWSFSFPSLAFVRWWQFGSFVLLPLYSRREEAHWSPSSSILSLEGIGEGEKSVFFSLSPACHLTDPARLLLPSRSKIINASSDYLQDQYRWQRGMKEEFERLRENHPKIQAVVSASPQAQIRDRNPALNSWIWQLRDAIDEADDVLDDFEYVKLEEQLTRNKKQQKVRSTLSSSKKIGKRALKMDPNLKRLEKVVKKLDNVSAGSALSFISSKTQSRSNRSWSFSCAKIMKQVACLKMISSVEARRRILWRIPTRSSV